MSNVRYLRRKQAGEYLQSKFGFGSPRTLAKLATVGGGPAYFKAGAKTVVYEPAALDAWAEFSNRRGVSQHIRLFAPSSVINQSGRFSSDAERGPSQGAPCSETQWIRITAFDEGTQAELLRLDDGDAIAVQGPLKASPRNPPPRHHKHQGPMPDGRQM